MFVRYIDYKNEVNTVREISRLIESYSKLIELECLNFDFILAIHSDFAMDAMSDFSIFFRSLADKSNNLEHRGIYFFPYPYNGRINILGFVATCADELSEKFEKMLCQFK